MPIRLMVIIARTDLILTTVFLVASGSILSSVIFIYANDFTPWLSACRTRRGGATERQRQDSAKAAPPVPSRKFDPPIDDHFSGYVESDDAGRKPKAMAAAGTTPVAGAPLFSKTNSLDAGF